MSDARVAALEEVYARWAASDFWTPEIFDPHVHIVWAHEMPGFPREEEGLASAERGLRDLMTAYAQYRWEAERFIPAGDRVVVFFIARGRGRGSSVEIDAQWAHVWTFSEGKATRVEGFLTRQEALAAAGLAE